jgi:hypothetical protein
MCTCTFTLPHERGRNALADGARHRSTHPTHVPSTRTSELSVIWAEIPAIFHNALNG